MRLMVVVIALMLWVAAPSAGAIALTDPAGAAVMDAIVYGSQQSNSSANGYITMPDLATVEGVQHHGGCIASAAVRRSTPRSSRLSAPRGARAWARRRR